MFNHFHTVVMPVLCLGLLFLAWTGVNGGSHRRARQVVVLLVILFLEAMMWRSLWLGAMPPKPKAPKPTYVWHLEVKG